MVIIVTVVTMVHMATMDTMAGAPGKPGDRDKSLDATNCNCNENELQCPRIPVAVKEINPENQESCV